MASPHTVAGEVLVSSTPSIDPQPTVAMPVMQTISKARAPSTHASYNQKWRVFSEWCQSRQLDATTCPIHMVLHYLQSLLDVERASSTVKVYTAAITFGHDAVGGVSVGRHSLVSQFIKGAYRLRPDRALRAPSWDLPLVLADSTPL